MQFNLKDYDQTAQMPNWGRLLDALRPAEPSDRSIMMPQNR